jgi:drug/metabolite transporter (DMT)-like permease
LTDISGRSANAGIALAVASGLAFAALPILAKLAYDAGADALPLLGVRFLVAVALLLAFRAVRRRPPAASPGTAVKLVLFGGLLYGGEALMLFLALERAPAGIVGLIFYSYPLWTTLIGFATGLEPFRSQIVIALALGTAGVASIFTVSSGGVSGPLFALGAAVTVAVFLLLTQVFPRGVDSPRLALWTTVGAAATTGVAALGSGGSLPGRALLPGAAMGVLTAISYLFLYAAIAQIGSTRSSIANMVEPVTTVVLAAIVLDERVTLRIALAAALVVSALPVLASARPRVEAPTDTA